MNNETQRRVAGQILALAKTAVTTVRGTQHGNAEESFTAIGDMWTAYLNALSIRQTGLPLPGLKIMARDVALMMDQHKQMRIVFGDETLADNYVDGAGYMSLAGMFHVPEKNVGLTSSEAAPAPEQPPAPTFLTEPDQTMGEALEIAGQKKTYK